MPPSSVSAERLLSYSERASSRQGQLPNLRTGSGALPNTGHLPFTIRKHDWPIGTTRLGSAKAYAAMGNPLAANFFPCRPRPLTDTEIVLLDGL